MKSEEVIREIRSRSNTCVLAFSRGKDSIAAWLAIRPHFERVVPVHYYLCPGLEFVEESVRYYEKFFGTRILRVPHPSLYRMLNALVFQPPVAERIAEIEYYSLPEFDYDLLRRGISSDLGCPDPEGWWVAVGTRANDSPQRRLAFRTHGAVRQKGRQFFPVWDWNKDRLLGEIKNAGVLLPPEYRVFGRSFDGLDFRFLYGIKKHWPRDYAKILEWFPMAEVEIERYQFHLKRKGKS